VYKEKHQAINCKRQEQEGNHHSITMYHCYALWYVIAQ